MKKCDIRKICVTCFICLSLCVVPGIIHPASKGVKTSYKRYSILKVNGQDFLCEPYVVDKDDWLYKIFRKKGEISEKDFPFFLKVFKEMNPQISNIDAIEPGNQILIPLKKVEKTEYDQSSPGTVDVPVIEFSAMREDPDLSSFLNKHTVKEGDNVSSLIDKEFLEQGGRLSEEGLKAFQLANPNIKNVNIIHEGEDVFLPDPDIRTQPWFESLLSVREQAEPEPGAIRDQPASLQQKVDENQLALLKKYTSLIGGTLMSKGKIYFPRTDGEDSELDLSATPLIEGEDGSKILLVSGTNVNELLLASVQAYWKDLRIQYMADALEQARNEKQARALPKKTKSSKTKQVIETILFKTGHDYVPNAKIPFSMNGIQLEAAFGRIIRENQTDLLINHGNVYGEALAVIRKKGFEIISLSPQQSGIDIASRLFSDLGYSTWENPSFLTGDIVETVYGLYAAAGADKFFIPTQALTNNAIDYLNKESVKIFFIDTDLPQD